MENKRVLVKTTLFIVLFLCSFDVYADSTVYDTFKLYLQPFVTD